ncbi:DLIC-domain-containing protein [Violaceomyces palustris]|uniref:DLIC-domain-containing protein n=1 Tax=Violaceomyces palustris TaxID=1673888 RepID=A0ACD0NVV2_9BASI|nr:DLIC-domain-containing protein [Violaceomyces palustris]
MAEPPPSGGQQPNMADMSIVSNFPPMQLDGEEPVHDLWGSILNSVNSSKSIPTKNIVLLGEPKTGKSTLISSLASKSPSGFIASSDQIGTPLLGSEFEDASTSKDGAKGSRSKQSSKDLGLGYGYFDVGDEKEGDETIARIGVYTLHSSHPSYTSLLPFAFPAPLGYSNTSATDTASTSALASTSRSRSSANLTSPKASLEALKDSLVLITLDWERPWTFLEQLRNWLEIFSNLIDKATDGALLGRTSARSNETKIDLVSFNRTQMALEEMKERLEAYIRSYIEPQAAESSRSGDPIEGEMTTTILPATITGLSSALEGDEQSPLAEGMLTDNWGVPIVVTCTKADTIAKLEREKDFKEEQFDYIQQVLRTVCMKYGAALFFTDHSKSQSFDILRSYVLHRLFTPPSSQSLQLGSSSTNTTAAGGALGPGSTSVSTGSGTFPFPYRASTVDRDTLLVPSGWDSWGKIKALRDGFDCKGMAKGWENDCELERLRQSRGLPKNKETEDLLEKEIEIDSDENGGVRSAVKLYEDIVADWKAAPPMNPNASRVKQPDEQGFLGQHYAALQKDPDPRSKFSRQSQSSSTSSSQANGSGERGYGKSVVGPMGSSSLSLPSVERAISDKDVGTLVGDASIASGRSRSSRKDSRDARGSLGGNTGSNPLSNGRNNSSSTASSSMAPGLSNSSSAGGGTSLTSPKLALSTNENHFGAAGKFSSSLGGSSRPSSPAVGGGGGSVNGSNNGGTSPSGAPKQSEVLHSFFQSLLKDKTSSTGSPRISRSVNTNSTTSSNSGLGKE